MFVLSMALVSSPAMAEMAGLWHVTGEVSGRAFVVDCKFAPDGAQFGGVCVDALTGDAKVKAGKAHKLMQGSIVGHQVRWTYPISVMFMSVDLNFAGVQTGNRMTETMAVKGRNGTFAAIRS